uniref:Interleukin-1 receptor-associated kinase 4 n=1 Tax=Geotrypetes seraphini TaxID=260995 RepID=A0A6P8SFD0_GEOSA|nr:interleukin-1 receptor-associated kinase 4 isoform X2 [Geotrypetes seraphini]XP_033815330.1 interleukin-1 receptor-associated kinase 4 isoform X2 [Geotrypetes seraphini]XP_033815332.1 interleukin-1 receptor-associated kinase 4 isoform X2 [Geotrypetes seraphini]XP_033815333.1 interleukin-1 receptor-associated kinase 4 isoform X2 [Geotrypetes seraphini]
MEENSSRYKKAFRRFEGSIQMGKSPTCELLFDWGTTNCTVDDLVELLKRNEFLAAAALLLPDSVKDSDNAAKWTSKNTIPIHEIHMASDCPAENLEVPCSISDSRSENSSQDSETGFCRFSFEELNKSTNNFDDRPVSAGGRKVGEGGFGVVYKGTVNSRTVAVKKLTTLVDISIQELKDQFDQEIKTMAKCRHENLVELIGFSSDHDDHCLVYVYMPNGSLLDRLTCLDSTPPLSWIKRCNIALGSAHGINFLHENNHTHRDIKSANILLNENFVPKISDFGLARACGQLKNTVMTERIVGTTAYMAPEALRGEITIKSDIFSFGVVLLEIITGLSALDETREPQLLIDIKEEIEDEEKTIEDYVDENIGREYSTTIEKMFLLASRCLHQLKNKRPVINKVQQDLEKIVTILSV